MGALMTTTTPDSKLDDDTLVIDCDSHWCETPDFFTSRAPASLRDRMPHVEQIEGRPTWVFDGHPLGPASAGAVIGRDGRKVSSNKGLFEWTIDMVHQGAWDPKARLQVLDECGISAQVIYPNTIGLGGQSLGVVKDQELCRTAIQIYNDAMAEIQADSGQPPPADAAHAGLERRGVDRRGASGSPCSVLRGVNMTQDPQDLGAPDLGDRAWDPFWEVCTELELPVHFHIGASVTTMTFFGSYPWPSHPMRHAARHRRHPALRRERARRRRT